LAYTSACALLNQAVEQAVPIPFGRLQQASPGSFSSRPADYSRPATVELTLRELPEQRLIDALQVGGTETTTDSWPGLTSLVALAAVSAQNNVQVSLC
jgi:hypothetical protein